MAKIFKSYDEQIAFLREEKNLIITDDEYARHILAKTSYSGRISISFSLFCHKIKSAGYSKASEYFVLSSHT